MVGILDTIRKEVTKGFKGKLRKGTLRRMVPASFGTDGQVSETPTDYTFDGIRDSFSAMFAQAAGIPITDARILIIAGSLAVEPKQDDQILIDSQWFQVRQMVSVDPATASYTMAAFAIPAGAT